MPKAIALKAIIAFFLGVIISSTLSEASETNGSTTISVPIDSTQTVGEYTFPWPFSDYKLSIKIRIAANPVFSIQYSSDRDLISVGETVTFKLDVSPTKADLNSWVIVRLLKKAEVLMYKDVEVPKIQIRVPGIYMTPSIPVPLIPLHEFGVPLTVGLSLRTEVTTEIPFVIKVEKLTPSRYSEVITEDLLSFSSSFTKVEGVGARLIWDKAGLNFEGKLYVGLTVVELPLVKYEFSSLPLYALSSETSVDKELLKLKSPLTVSISTLRERAVLGDPLSFSGRIFPQGADIKVDLLARKIGDYWFTVGTALTASDGSFIIGWSPTEAGEYEITAHHAGGEYSIEAWSDIIKVRILRPAEFKVQNIVISPSEAKAGSAVTVSIDVLNIGEVTGTHTVTLRINGLVESTRDVTLSGGESEKVAFKVVRDVQGTYNVEVDGLSGSFVVYISLIEIWLPYIAATIIVVLILTITVILIKRRK